MTEKQAYNEAKEIFRETAEKARKITETARQNGSLQMGLDANKGLYEQLDCETKEKLKTLRATVE